MPNTSSLMWTFFALCITLSLTDKTYCLCTVSPPWIVCSSVVCLLTISFLIRCDFLLIYPKHVFLRRRSLLHLKIGIFATPSRVYWAMQYYFYGWKFQAIDINNATTINRFRMCSRKLSIQSLNGNKYIDCWIDLWLLFVMMCWYHFFISFKNMRMIHVISMWDHWFD